MREKPTLVVLHGGPGGDHSGLRPYFDRFADTHQVLYLDHRGNGRSSGERKTWTLAQWGADVKRVCDILGIEKPIVCGLSFGGMVAMSYAAQFPEHPSKPILGSTATRLNLPASYDIFEARGGKAARNVAERIFTRGEEEGFEDYRNVCLPLYNKKPMTNAAAVLGRSVLRSEVASHFFLGEMRTMDTRKQLARIACPTLVLAGTYDPITPLFCSEEIMGGLRDGIGTLSIFVDAGHGVYRDDPDGAECAIRVFLGDGLSRS